MIKAAYTSQMYQRLTSAGCSVLPPKGVRNAPRLEMWQAEQCSIEEVQHVTICIFELALLVILPCYIDRFDLTILGWSKEHFRCLMPEEYHLKSFPEYPEERILNSVADTHIKLETGRLLEGVLLGIAPGKIPTYYMSPLTVTISVYDTLENVTSVDCEAGIHRLQIPRRSAQRQSLFDDNIVRNESGQPVQWLETPQRQQPVEPEEY